MIFNDKNTMKLFLSSFLSLSLLCAGGSYAQTYVLNGKSLPLGNGKYTSTAAKRGYVYSCVTQFTGGGASKVGSWIHGTTWDETQKIAVKGTVSWPSAVYSITISNGKRVLTGNNLPINHTTGTFPISKSDPAYLVDMNPNTIKAQQLTYSLPLTPTVNSKASCLPMGVIGVMVSGVPIFNALDALGRDAVANEVQDNCSGHPEGNGKYHYHSSSKCIKGALENNTLIGYALDGFGIYSMFDENGKELTNADLDECHGRVSPVMWDGKKVNMYHYVMTREYPYTVGCYRGTAVKAQTTTR